LEDFSDENEVLKLNITFANKAKRMRMLPNPKMQPKRQVFIHDIKIKKQEINAEE
jgi:cullin 1